MPRQLTTLQDLDRGDLDWLVDRSVHHARGDHVEQSLRGRAVGTLFTLTSTRTRTAFAVAAGRLGAQTVTFGPTDLQLNTGESRNDTGRVLATMLDTLVVRASISAAEMGEFVTGTDLGLVNAMSTCEHPTQAIADLATMKQRLGRLEGLRVVYLGEGNSTAVALALALSRYPGTTLYLLSPTGYGIPEWAVRATQGQPGAVVHGESPDAMPREADVVYTTQWQTTGTTKPDPDWRSLFEPFAVTAELMGCYPGAVFMHDLPAHRGDEVEGVVLDGPQSLAFVQAGHKLTSAMAVLEWVGSTARPHHPDF